jgi:hypothetical protein
LFLGHLRDPPSKAKTPSLYESLRACQRRFSYVGKYFPANGSPPYLIASQGVMENFRWQLKEFRQTGTGTSPHCSALTGFRHRDGEEISRGFLDQWGFYWSVVVDKQNGLAGRWVAGIGDGVVVGVKASPHEWG